MLGFLFGQEADLDGYAAIDAILAAARHDASLRTDVLAASPHLETFVAAAIRVDHPQCPDRQVAGLMHELETPQPDTSAAVSTTLGDIHGTVDSPVPPGPHRTRRYPSFLQTTSPPNSPD